MNNDPNNMMIKSKDVIAKAKAIIKEKKGNINLGNNDNYNSSQNTECETIYLNAKKLNKDHLNSRYPKPSEKEREAMADFRARHESKASSSKKTNCSTGNCNTGNCNTGNCNTNDCNTGNCNTGNCNTGNCNTGNCNKNL